MRSTWVSASAGSGKTFMFVERILMLLLSGEKSDNIFCITFTNSAVNEIQERIESRLLKWASINLKLLSQEVEEILHYVNDVVLDRARKLFDCIIVCPININTMHGFCSDMLRDFAVELGISPDFIVIDGVRAENLLDMAFGEYCSEDYSESISTDLNKEIIFENIHKIRSCVDLNMNSVNKFINDLSDFLKINTTHGIYNYIDLLYKDTGFDVLDLVVDDSRVVLMQRWLGSSAKEKMLLYSEYKKLFFTNKDVIRKTILPKKLLSRVKDFINSEVVRIDLLRKRVNDYDVFNKNAKLFNFYANIIEKYNRLKKKNNVLDYNDLIFLFYRGLKDNLYVRHKVDYKVNHILVDEAQDNSFYQWEVIRLIIEEFFCGDSSKNILRSFFIVGDVRQSIYSFQGAIPEYFYTLKNKLSCLVKNNMGVFEYITQNTSYRSDKNILSLVNLLLKDKKIADAVMSDLNSKICSGYKNAKDGLVLIYDLVAVNNDNENLKQGTARLIVKTISEWLQNKRVIFGSEKVILPGDIMILVRQRTDLVDFIVNECINFNIDYDVGDKTPLFSCVIVKDLLALAKFAVNSSDCLSLALLLKSVFFKLDDADVCKVVSRDGRKDVINEINIIVENVNFFTPSQFFINFLINKNYTHVLSDEDLLYVSKFIELIISYEQDNILTLQQVINKLTSEKIICDSALKNKNKNKVCIFTVHAAKGSESPIVIFADTVDVPVDKDNICFVNNLPIFYNRKELIYKEIVDYKNKLIYDEYLRLLYVGVTRAKNELHIFGWKKQLCCDQKSWYEIIDEKLNGL